MIELDDPDWQRDCLIIANARLRALIDAGLVSSGEQGRPVEPFLCRPRGYLMSEMDWVMTFDPDSIIRDELWRVVSHGITPFEVWILENDGVVEFAEIQPPAERN